jgi:branched-subunit amino acid aminotransferase/4-amino-4-deoxychorismate lyase
MQAAHNFLILNGKIIGSEDIHGIYFPNEPTIKLCQKIWFGFGGIPLFSENLKLLKQQVKELKLIFPDELENEREQFRLVKRMLNKNKFYQSGYIWVQLIYSDGNTLNSLKSSSIKGFNFPASDDNLLINFSSLRKNSQNFPNRYAFFNEKLWDVARAEIKDTSFEQSILLNENGFVCEAIGSNIFMLKGNEFITPSLTTGCYDDPLRKIVFKAAEKAGLIIKEAGSLGQNDLSEMDEVFLASEQNGFQWVKGIGQKRFFRTRAQVLYSFLNELLQKKAEMAT